MKPYPGTRSQAWLRAAAVVALALLASACMPKSRMVKADSIVDAGPPLGLALDDPQGPSLDVRHVVVRNGPGSWARDADWDEYVLEIANPTAEEVTILGLTLVAEDIPPSEPSLDRAALEGRTRANLRALKAAGIVVGVGVVTPTVLVGASLGGGSGYVGMLAAAEAMMIVMPVALLAAGTYVIGGAVQESKDRKAIDAELARRGIVLPLVLAPGESRRLSAFFPVTPGPRRMSMRSTGPAGAREVDLDLAPLGGLHVKARREPPDDPKAS